MFPKRRLTYRLDALFFKELITVKNRIVGQRKAIEKMHYPCARFKVCYAIKQSVILIHDSQGIMMGGHPNLGQSRPFGKIISNPLPFFTERITPAPFPHDKIIDRHHTEFPASAVYRSFVPASQRFRYE